MRLEHIGINVDDLEAMRNFYQQYFGAVANAKYTNQKTGLQTYFLSFENGARLEIMSRHDSAIRPGYKKNRRGSIHIAFDLKTRQEVDRLTAELEQAGYMVFSAPRVTGDGYYESVVLDPEQNQIELMFDGEK